MGTSKVKKAQVAARRTEALRLRAQRKTLDEIMAAVPGYSSRAMVSQDITRALQARLAEERQAVDELRQLELEHLDQLAAKAWEILQRPHLTVSHGKVIQVTTPAGEKINLRDDGPTLAALDRLVKIHERRAKLLGLDAPARVDTTGIVTFQIEGVDLDQLR